MGIYLKESIVVIFITITTTLFSQTFNAEGGYIKDYDGTFHVDTFPIQVSNTTSVINENFGLEKVCLSIRHSRISDIRVELVSPDGTSIWLTNRNGRDEGANYSSTCFRSNGFSGYVHRGEAPFVGEYIPDGRMEFFNNGQNPNGTWYLLIRDLQEGEKGALYYVYLQFGQNPNPNQGQSPCSFDNGKLCACPSGERNCALLPDLIMLPAFTKDQIKEYPKDHPTYPRQLRLAATIANIGDGPLETRGKNEWFCGKISVNGSVLCPDSSYARQQLYQRVYYKQGDTISYQDIKAGTNYYDDKPGHDHFHADDWIEIRLVKYKSFFFGFFKKKKIIAKGSKVSYCLFDTGACSNADNLCAYKGISYGNRNLPNYGLGGYSSCKSEMQGISVGGYDTYGMMYEGQVIELPIGLKSGVYTLEIEIDPTHRYKEKNRTNNIFAMDVAIKLQE